MERSLVFLAVNASYAHTNLAAWYLRAYAERAGWSWHEVEISRNDSIHAALIQVARLHPAVLAATFYLFNRPFLLSFISRFKALYSDCLVVAGGPEFLGDNRCFLSQYPFINVVIRGEGELAFAEWIKQAHHPERWADIPGFCGFMAPKAPLIHGRYVDNGMAPVIQRLDDIPSPYPVGLASFTKPFILLETSRGCSNQCGFCTSADVPVRYFSMARVRQDLQRIADHGVPEVRVADRTFNDRPSRCLPLIRMFRDEFKSLRFHLEIDPARITPAMLSELAQAGSGRFHLEVGAQTLNPAVIRNLRRQGTVKRSLEGLSRLCRLRNLNVHVDLIAGLPGAALAELFDELKTLVFLHPAEIQLEVLKLLLGTRLAQEKDRWRIIAAPEPPYEVLRTSTLSAEDVETARKLSRLVDWFYNVPELQDVCVRATRLLPDFWKTLISWCDNIQETPFAPSLENRFKLLNDFFKGQDVSLTQALHYAWLKRGFSAQHGICRTRLWKGPIPASALLLEGAAPTRDSRLFLAEMDHPYLFVYGRDRRAMAIYRLPS